MKAKLNQFAIAASTRHKVWACGLDFKGGCEPLKQIAKMFIFSSASLAFAGASEPLVIPFERANLPGSSRINEGFTTSSTIQQLYGASLFSGPVVITGLAFRPDESPGVTSLAVSIPTLTLQLSTFSKSVSLFTTSYAANKGADEVNVFAGSVDWRSTDLPGAVANPFDFKVIFANPFYYDPAKGGLLIQFGSNGSGNVGADVHFEGTSDLTKMVLNGGINSGAFVTEFTVIPVPEPSVITLFIMGPVVYGLSRSKK